MKKIILLQFIFILNSTFASTESLYKKVFPTYTKLVEVEVLDKISDDPVNTKILKVMQGKSIIGFIRNINTTTGCNSACLPVVYTSFYNKNGSFKKILSNSGLTKLNHAEFTAEDYSQLELILIMPSEKFKLIKHPKEMTDAISGATIKKFQNTVVKEAAYSTLRIHLYNQNTIMEISKLLK